MQYVGVYLLFNDKKKQENITLYEFQHFYFSDLFGAIVKKIFRIV